MSSSPPPFLPNDLIAEVLSLLKVKSIMRLRCVCKFWNNLIFDPTFVNLHLKKSAKQNPHFLLITGHNNINLYENNTNFYENRLENGVIPYPISSLVENPSFTFTVDSYYLLQDKECNKIVGSCNGLICFSGETLIGDYCQYWFQLWNPATRTTSPKFGFFGRHCTSNSSVVDDKYKFTFGCDHSTGTFKVVASCCNINELRSQVKILSLGDHVWRDIQTFPVDPLFADSTYKTDRNLGVYLKSTINWLAIQNYIVHDYDSDSSDDIMDYFSVEQFVILSLDLRTEAYNQYLLPREFDEIPSAAPTIAVLGDSLCFSYCYKETHLIIWQMKEFGVQDSWTLFLKVSYRSLQIDYDYSNEDIKYFFELVPLFLSKDGDTLLLTSSKEKQEIIYNRRNDGVERTKITARKSVTDDQIVDSVTCSANSYFESLVSVFWNN